MPDFNSQYFLACLYTLWVILSDEMHITLSLNIFKSWNWFNFYAFILKKKALEFFLLLKISLAAFSVNCPIEESYVSVCFTEVMF